MSNIHGLDFLRKEHTLNADGRANINGKSHSASADLPAERSQAWIGPDLETLAAQVANKPDLEKQFDVIHFLQAHRSSGCLAPSVIYQRTGIDLQEDEAVAEMLQHNPKIRVEMVPDPENPSLMLATYAYQAKYNHVRDRTTLLAQINRCKNGVPRRDLEDAYDGVESDLDFLITAGDVLAVQNSEDKTQIIFPRGEAFLVELDGLISIPTEKMVHQKVDDPPIKLESGIKHESKEEDGPQQSTENGETPSKSDTEKPADNSVMPTPAEEMASEGIKEETKDESGVKETARETAETTPVSSPNPTDDTIPGNPSLTRKPKEFFTLDTDLDPKSQIRRGEAIQIGGQWFRVSSAVKDGPLKDQPARAQAPMSVVMLQDLSKRNDQDGYIRPLTDRIIPIDDRLSESAVVNLQKARQARERLLKVAHGRSGGVASQLLGSHAHSSNPTTLAASFGTAAISGGRKRPLKMSGRDSQKDQKTRTDNAAHAKEVAADPYLALYSHARRHGCTKDVREMYLATRSLVPESDADLKKRLLQHKLLEPGEEMRRPRLKPRSNVDNDGKPKKRRYYERKNQRMTNTHLEGTEIGAVLRRAQEKQKQGESVGDGGM